MNSMSAPEATITHPAWAEGWARVSDARAEAKRIEENARALADSLVALIEPTECPHWCSAATSNDRATLFHEWRSTAGALHARRTHRGQLNSWIVEQMEFVEADGRRWAAPLDRIEAGAR